MRALRFAGRAGLSFFSYNTGWWACAFGVSYGYPWLGPALLPFWIALHLKFSPTPRGEALFFVHLAAIGFVVDSALIFLGLFHVPGATTFWAPAWLTAMWILLGFTFESLLPWRPKRWAFLAIAAISGPLTYIWCDAIEILKYARPLWAAIGVHALLWVALTPLLFRLRDFCLMAVHPIGPEKIRTNPELRPAEPVRLDFLERPSARPASDHRTAEAPSIEH